MTYEIGIVKGAIEVYGRKNAKPHNSQATGQPIQKALARVVGNNS